MPPMRFCRARNQSRRCTRELDHRGLHRSRTIMWADAASDAALCEASGSVGEPAPALANGYPHGRALCPTCGRFVKLSDGKLDPHDTTAEESAEELENHHAWFNTHGW